MKKHILTVLIASGLVSFGLYAIPSAPGEYRNHLSEKSSSPPYFPMDEHGINGLTEFEAEWFGKVLKNMNEPSLFTDSDNGSAYRALLIPAWGQSICSRLTVQGTNRLLTVRCLDGQGEDNIGTLILDRQSIPAIEQIDDFKRLFDAIGFFEQPADDPHAGLDGSEWILEANENGKYHIVVRWSPNRTTPFAKAFSYLLELSQNIELNPEKE